MNTSMIGRWAAAVAAAGGVLMAAPFAVGQTRAETRRQGPSSDLNTENRRVIDENQPRRYEVYDPGAGYGSSLYLNDQYFLRGTQQRDPQAQPNRQGLQPRRPPSEAETTDAADRPASPPAQRIRGQVARVQPAAAKDGRPVGIELVVTLPDDTKQAFWLGDESYVTRHLPPLSADEAVTIVGEPATADADADQAEGFVVRWVETPLGRFVVPYYRFGQVVEGPLLRTSHRAGEADRPAVLVGTLGMPDGREIDIVLGQAEMLTKRGIVPAKGDTVRIEGYLRSAPPRGWSFIVTDIKVGGESTRHTPETPEPAESPEPAAKPAATDADS